MTNEKPGTRAGVCHVVPIPDVQTGWVHLVTDEAMVAGRRAGLYLAVCGAEALAASLTVEGERFCSLCREWARA